ncbi:MAG: glycosyl hydrolase [Candidatus Hydrogenedentota bacterium]
MKIQESITPETLRPQVARFFELAGEKIRRLDQDWDPDQGAPVFTIEGKYTTRGWTEWTEGFVYGCQVLQSDATGDAVLYELGRKRTFAKMAPHVSHIGVHDHGFNNVSTYGNLRRLALEGRAEESEDALAFYELALKVSGAVQAARWSTIEDGSGYVHSFNGPQSLFSDTIRSCRAMVLADRLGHVLMGEHDERISLRARAIQHIENTLRYNVYYGGGRDSYDVPGRVVHESIFNMNDGKYRCPSTQQGYSPFSTWTRGLAWIVLGCAEQLEYFHDCGDADKGFMDRMIDAAKLTADFFIANTTADGIPFWDTGAPGLVHMPDYREKNAEPDNPHEPIDSSAAAITAQGLLRLGNYLGREKEGKRYWQAGLTAAQTLFAPPFMSEDTNHHGLLLHAIYHQPNGWDHVPAGKQVPQGESCMWGDYHAMELAVYLQRVMDHAPYYTFFGPCAGRM